MPGGARRLAALDGVLQRAIQNRGWNPLVQLGGDVTDRFEQTVEVKTGSGGGENHRRIVEKEQLTLHPVRKPGQRGDRLGSFAPFLFLAPGDFLRARFTNALRHEVPFVDHDDAGALFLVDFVRDLFVLLLNAGLGIENEQGDVAAGDRILRPLDAEKLDRVVNAAGFADAGGID